MKKPFFILSASTLVAGALIAQASGDGILTTLDGRTLNFDQPAIMQGGRVMVPLRGIFESLGADVLFDNSTRTIKATKGSRVVELTLGSSMARIDGKPTYLDVPADAVQGRTLVPLRFVSEALGADVRWNPALRTVSLSQVSADETPQASLPVTPAQPRLDNVVHNGHRDMQGGERLVVTSSGDANAQVSFDLVGVARGVPMREVSPGRYEGEMAIPSQLTVPRAPLVVHLRRGDQEVTQEARRPVSLAAAQEALLFPREGSLVTVSRPDIRATLNRPLQAGSARIFLDGQDVTSQAAVTPLGLNATSFQYQPAVDLGPGTHQVSLQAIDRNGEWLTKNWSFQIQQTYSGASGTPLNLTNLTNGTGVPAFFNVQGQTAPYAQVNVLAQAQTNLIPGVLGVQTKVDQKTRQADALGRFDVPLDASKVPSNTPITLRIQVLNANGLNLESRDLSVTRL